MIRYCRGAASIPLSQVRWEAAGSRDIARDRSADKAWLSPSLHPLGLVA